MPYVFMGLTFPVSFSPSKYMKTLTPQQLQYAANDAHASLLVYKALSEG